MVAFLATHSIVPDFLFNNAGIGAYSLYRDVALAAEQEVLDLDVVLLTHLTKLLLAPMLARGSVRILNVASTAAFQPGPAWRSSTRARPTRSATPQRSHMNSRGRASP